MRKYDYLCSHCHAAFEAEAGLDARFVTCRCGSEAERRPFSGVPNLHGSTVARSIPDPAYRQEAIKRDFTQSWGDASRAVEGIRKNMFVDAEGNKMLDVKGMQNA